MRKRPSYQTIFVLGLAIYLLTLLCITVVSGVVIYSKHRNLVTIAENDLNYYLENGTFNPRVKQREANNFVYLPDGSREAFQSSSRAELVFDFDGYAQELSRHVSAGSPVYRLKFSLDLPHHVAVVVAIPMENGGLFLFLKELPDVDRVLVFLYMAITLLCVLCVFYLFFALRSSRTLEKMQREYVDNISHELKSPVAAVKALAEPIYDGMVKDEESLQKYSGIMLSELSNLERTISEMLELSRIQNHRLAVEKKRVTAQAVFGDIVAKYSVLCDEFGLSFLVDPPLEKCPVLHTNRELASRMLDILLDNAFKFTQANGMIQVILTEQQRHMVVTIRNDGPSIEAADQKHIFERFYQGGKAHDKRGSGLGLAIAKEIAESLNEKLWLEHSVPGDTAFSFTISSAR